MADLDALIRLRKHTVDQKQKFLAGLYRQIEVLQQKQEDLKDGLERERKLLETQEMLEALSYYGRYASGVKVQIELIQKDIDQLEKRIEIARADLREAFSDMKKVEITARRREEELKKEMQSKEDQELDEIALEGYRRSQNADE
jgi:flagellar export protein FliJ